MKNNKDSKPIGELDERARYFDNILGMKMVVTQDALTRMAYHFKVRVGKDFTMARKVLWDVEAVAQELFKDYSAQQDAFRTLMLDAIGIDK